MVFREASHYLAQIRHPRILSFGCSTGEEVATLREYLPQATIMGVDINAWCIRQCRKKHPHPQNSFLHRLSSEFEMAEGFDAIFCMAVFQQTENRTRTDNDQASGFPFQHFEQEIRLLNKKLKPGGLIIIDNTDFRFSDTDISHDYIPMNFDKNRIQRNRPLFDRNNKKLSDVTFEHRVFIKSPSETRQPNQRLIEHPVEPFRKHAPH